MTAPLIGIVGHVTRVEEAGFQAPHHVANSAYVKAVRKAGGLPVVLPLVEPDDAAALVARVDGIVLTGGFDVDPASYGEAPQPETGPVDAERDAADIAACRAAVDGDVPALAICRGAQVLNVAMGGTVTQHVEGHNELRRYNETVHAVGVEAGSRLAAWLGGLARVDVNTLHHQAIAAPGEGVRLVACADDGTVEGVEVDGCRAVVGVQWHPELLRHLPLHLGLFEALVRASAG